MSLTSIEIDENRTGIYSLTLEATDYQLLPHNAANRPEPEPYRQIELLTWGSQTAWPASSQVKLTGIFGWPQVPPAIVSATIEITGILRLESPRATNAINEMNQVLGTSRRAQDIIDELRRAYTNPAVYV